MKYILNSAVIANGGDGIYQYETIGQQAANAWLHTNTDAQSRIGYPETVEAIRSFFGVDVALNRASSLMQAGDEALVIRLEYRVDNPALKKGYKPNPADYTFGLLRRIS